MARWIAEAVVEDLNANLVKGDDQPVATQRYLDKYSPYYRSQPGVHHVYNIDQVKDCERTLGMAFPDKKPPAQKKRYKRSEELPADLVRDHDLRIVQGRPCGLRTELGPRDDARYPPVRCLASRRRTGRRRPLLGYALA